jgi:hypothetical protein
MQPRFNRGLGLTSHSEAPLSRIEGEGFPLGGVIAASNKNWARNDLRHPLPRPQKEVNIVIGKIVAAVASRPGARTIAMGIVALGAAFPLMAQDSAVQERLAMVKQAMAANAQKLHQYQWVETTQITLNGDAKPARQNSCQYGPDGTVQKTPLGPPPQPSGGPLKRRIIENKQAEMKQYLGEVKGVLAMYLPPDPQKMEQVKQAGNLSVNPVLGAINLVFKNYAQPGDQLILSFDTTAKKISSLNVNTYMGDAHDAVTLQVQMASLPDGTNYPQQTILNATAKQLVVTTTNSNYQKLGGA